MKKQGIDVTLVDPDAPEEEIEKAPVKMLVPLGVLVVPAMLLAILGPLLASAASFGR